MASRAELACRSEAGLPGGRSKVGYAKVGYAKVGYAKVGYAKVGQIPVQAESSRAAAIPLMTAPSSVAGYGPAV